jgi:hypothetical protein
MAWSRLFGARAETARALSGALDKVKGKLLIE